MTDQYGRSIDYLRISITDRCNLRCRYCMPNGCEWLPRTEILTMGEFETITRLAAELGIRKVKITGGEPLVRRCCVELVGVLKAIPGIEQVTMTTNGVLLAENIRQLKENGLDAVNISLDTLNREKYTEITGKDALEDTIQGIHAAMDAGLRVKLNAVLQKGVNDSEWPELVELARNNPLDVRFIEMMPIGHGRQYRSISNAQLLEKLEERYGALTPDSAIHGNGPAVYYKIPGFTGSIGLISAIHGKFCHQCNRIRLTSTGYLKSCLCYESGADLREPLRRGDLEGVRERLHDAIFQKPQSHCFEELARITEQHEMSKIGG